MDYGLKRVYKVDPLVDSRIRSIVSEVPAGAVRNRLPAMPPRLQPANRFKQSPRLLIDSGPDRKVRRRGELAQVAP